MKNTTTTTKEKNTNPSTFEKVTEVKTGYARIALMLVLANLFLTGYVISKISTLEEEAPAESKGVIEQPTATSSESTGGDI